MGAVKLVCLTCSASWEVPEGSNVSGIACPRCGTAQDSHFTHAKSVQFRPVASPAYAKACELARVGDREAALAALEEALKEGVDMELVDSDPALGRLRGDPRFTSLVRRFRPA